MTTMHAIKRHIQWNRRVPAVRIYPSGGIICHSVPFRETMSIPFALKELAAGRPACVWLDNLHIILEMLRPEIKLVTVKMPNALGIEWYVEKKQYEHDA